MILKKATVVNIVKLSRLLPSTAIFIGVCVSLTALGANSGSNERESATSSITAEDTGGASLEAIIVTAQRRDTDLSKTPVAVSVLSADALAKQQIVTESDLQSAVPGLSVRATGNSNQLNYAIRGQSLDAFSNSAPGVLPYVNEVQVGNGGGASSFYDLQSVQVLKGPQGTLFGRNSTGGAVLFTTAKPTNDVGGYIAARVGDYSLKQFEGALNVPVISDRLLVRVAAFYQKQDGFQYNLYTNSRVGNVDRYGLRGSITAKFSDSLKNDLVVDYFHSRGDSVSLVIYGLNPAGAIPAAFLATPGVDAVFGPGTWASYLAAHPKSFPGGINAFLPIQQARGPFLIDVDGSNEHFGNNLLLSDVSTWQIGTDTQIKNVFGVNNIKQQDFNDIDGSPFGIIDNGSIYRNDGSRGQPIETKQYSEELQLGGTTLDHKLTYVTGAYYSDDKIEILTTTRVLQLQPFLDGGFSYHHALTRHKNYAGYAQGTYDLSDATGVQGLGFTAGGRYSRDKGSLQILPGDPAFSTPDSPTFQKYQEHSDNKVSYQFGLQEQFNSSLMAYILTRKSNRSGGFNALVEPVVGLGDTGGNRFLPETATDVELGLKFQGALGSIPARLNLATYHMSVKNQQRVAFPLVNGATAAITVNVPKAQMDGLEADGQLSLASWLRVGGAVSYINAKFKENATPVLGQVQYFGPYPDADKWSGSLFTEFLHPLSDSLELAFHAEVYDQTGTYFSSTYNTISPGTAIPGYAIANFRLGVEDTKLGWSLSANLKNAFNRVYYAGGSGTSNVTGASAVVPGAPRTFSVEARYKF